MVKFKKPLLIIGIAMLITLGIIYFYPRKINTEYSGLMYRIGDSNYTEDIKIIINGYFSKGLFKGDKFRGTITIGEIQLSGIDMRFDSFNRGHLYNYVDGDYSAYGTIFINDKVDEFTIGILEEDEKGSKTWSSGAGLMISAPAHSREAAVKLSNRLMEDMFINEEIR